MPKSMADRLATLSLEERTAWIDDQPDWLLEEMARGEWWWTARPEQIPPETDWLVSLYLAGRGCVAPWTRIFLPRTGTWERIDHLAAQGSSVEVLALTDAGPARAKTLGAPFLKGHADYFTLTCDNGSVITVTDQHRFLTPQGWLQCADVRVGQKLSSGPGVTWTKILSIDPAGSGPFYDLTVPDGASYLAEGLWNHNSGKSRSGSEWIVERAMRHPTDRHGIPTEHLIIAETLSDGRLICMEGPAGVLRVLDRRHIKYRYIKSPKPMITFPEYGSKIFVEGADNADVGRGYNAASCWGDEICKWSDSYSAWYEGIMPSLRADLSGDHPRAFITTTPKPHKLIQEWVRRTDGTVHIIRGSTFDNRANLSGHMLKELETRYAGTTIGRQELYGELLEDIDGSLFSRGDISRHRVKDVPDGLIATVVGVDPSLTGEDDEMGIVVVGRKADTHMYVIADRTMMGAGRGAALHAWRVVAEYGADLLLYESNLGKQWMAQVFRDAYFELVGQGIFPNGTTPPMKGVDTKYGKKTRAEPVAMRLEQGKLHFVGQHPELEDQCALFDPDHAKDSPDRMDAMVHACRHLMAAERRTIRMATPQETTLKDMWLQSSYSVG